MISTAVHIIFAVILGFSIQAKTVSEPGLPSAEEPKIQKPLPKEDPRTPSAPSQVEKPLPPST